MSTSPYALEQISLRMPEGFLVAADRVIEHQKKALVKEGRDYQADRLDRSKILRKALEEGLLVLAKDLPCPKKEIFLPPEQTTKADSRKKAKKAGARAKDK